MLIPILVFSSGVQDSLMRMLLGVDSLQVFYEWNYL